MDQETGLMIISPPAPDRAAKPTKSCISNLEKLGYKAAAGMGVTRVMLAIKKTCLPDRHHRHHAAGRHKDFCTLHRFSSRAVQDISLKCGHYWPTSPSVTARHGSGCRLMNCDGSSTSIGFENMLVRLIREGRQHSGAGG